MTKKRFNLRKVATIVACLVVTMMFVACDKTNGDDDNGNTPAGNNKKLLGNWNYTEMIGTPPWDEWWYSFKDDGTFRMYLITTKEYSFSGNYKVSEGKVSFTNIVFRNDDYVENYPSKVAEYKFEKDSKGIEVLRIPQVNYREQEYLDMTKATSWYKK